MMTVIDEEQASLHLESYMRIRGQTLREEIYSEDDLRTRRHGYNAGVKTFNEVT